MRLRFPKDSRKPRKGINMERPTPTMLIRLTEDVGKLPSGFVYELPAFEAQRLIARRMATAVGNFRGILPDLVLTEDECQEAGL